MHVFLHNLIICENNMADFEGPKYDESKFQEALVIACNLLQVPSFYEDQEKAIRQFFRGKDIFFSAHTGYGKSLVFQAIPICSRCSC